MAAGFVHGVLNTDNINITGESFDYGPWRFLPTYDPGFTAAYFDETGLYAFGRQPDDAALEPDAARRMPAAAGAAGRAGGGAQRFWPAFQRAIWRRRAARGWACAPAATSADGELVERLFALPRARPGPVRAVLLRLARRLRQRRAGRAQPVGRALRDRGVRAAARDAWRSSSRRRTPPRPSLLRSAPTPCTMLIDEIEALWAPIAESDDWTPSRGQARARSTRCGRPTPRASPRHRHRVRWCRSATGRSRGIGLAASITCCPARAYIILQADPLRPAGEVGEPQLERRRP